MDFGDQGRRKLLNIKGSTNEQSGLIPSLPNQPAPLGTQRERGANHFITKEWLSRTIHHQPEHWHTTWNKCIEFQPFSASKYLLALNCTVDSLPK